MGCRHNFLIFIMKNSRQLTQLEFSKEGKEKKKNPPASQIDSCQTLLSTHMSKKGSLRSCGPFPRNVCQRQLCLALRSERFFSFSFLQCFIFKFVCTCVYVCVWRGVYAHEATTIRRVWSWSYRWSWGGATPPVLCQSSVRL